MPCTCVLGKHDPLPSPLLTESSWQLADAPLALQVHVGVTSGLGLGAWRRCGCRRAHGRAGQCSLLERRHPGSPR